MTGKPVGLRERRAGGTLISSEDCRILQMRIEDLQPGFDTPRAPMGAADLPAAAMPPTHRGMECVVRGRIRALVGWSAWCAGESWEVLLAYGMTRG